MKEIIIFIQAPADIQYALTIYEENKETAEISIFCINVEGMYKFIDSLDLNLKQLVFIPYDIDLSFKNPIKIFRARRKLISIYKKYFIDRKGYGVYFFSHFFDYITFYMVAKLSKKNKVIFVNHYDDAICRNYQRKINTIRYLKNDIFYKLNIGITLGFYQFNSRIIPEFKFWNYGIEEIKKNILNEKINKKYSYKIKDSIIGRVLFLEMDYKKEKTINNYKETTIKIIKKLSDKGYNIYLKPHPRLGYSKFLDNYIHEIVNKDVPAEFIDIDNFDFVLGISSSAIAYFSKNVNSKVFSMINLYSYKDAAVKNRAKQYLSDLSSGINYVNSIEDLDRKIIKKYQNE